MDNMIKSVSGNLMPLSDPGKKMAVKEGDFLKTLKSFYCQVDEQIKEADQKTAEFAVGNIHDIHEIMIASEKAGLSFKLLLQIRNKLLEAYQEIMRMQF